MKRLVATAVLGLVLGSASLTHAATLKPADADGLNLRAGPATTFAVVGGLSSTQSATVVTEQNGWFKIRLASGVEGWVSGQFSVVSYLDEQAYAAVHTDVLNLRAEPKTTAAVKAQLKQGETVRLLARTAGDWWQVRLTSGVEGWVSGQYMKRVAAPAPAAPAPTQPTTPAPAQPAPTQPAQPAPAQPQFPAEAPPAPANAVPTLPPAPPRAPVPVGAKEGMAVTASPVFFGRDTKAFDVTGKIVAGEKLTFLDSAEGWWKVQTVRGEKGWIPGSTAILSEGNLRYSITEGRWSIGYAGQSQAAPKPVTYQVRNTYALFIQDNGVMNILFKGELLTLVETQGTFLRMKTATGITGLLQAQDVIPIGAAEAQPVTDAMVATLSVIGTNQLRFDLNVAGKTIGAPKAEGNSLFIPLATGQQETRTLPVGEAGVTSVAVGPTGLFLTLERLPGWQVAEQAPGKLSVLLRPTLKEASVRSLPDRTAVSLKVDGLVEPKLSAAGGTVFMELPGTAAPAGLLVPPGVKVETNVSGLKLSFASRRAYAVKRTATGLELSLYAPGLKDKVILIDPGHGGFDAGAVNQPLSLQEQWANLQIALRLRAMLQEKGAKVLMTRTGNTAVAPEALLKGLTGTDRTQADLGYRTRMANELGVDLFLSIHHNSGDPYAGGTETYYTQGTLNGARSQELAKLLQGSMVQALGRKDRGAKNELFYVTRNTDAPAALVEVAFLDHGWESKLVKTAEFQHKAAQSLLQGIEKFYVERPN